MDFAHIGRFGKDVKYTLNKTKCREFDIKKSHLRGQTWDAQKRALSDEKKIGEIGKFLSCGTPDRRLLEKLAAPLPIFFGGMHLQHEFFTQHSQRLCML